MATVVSPRNYTLRTKHGHTVQFLKGVPKEIPDVILSEAMAVNILPVEGIEAYTEGGDAKGIQRLGITGTLREAIILSTFADMVRENASDDFDGGGKPKVGSVNERTGLSITAKERADMWAKYRQLTGEGEPLTSHKNAATVLEVQALRTAKDMLAMAELLGVDEGRLAGESLANQKAILLDAAIVAK